MRFGFTVTSTSAILGKSPLQNQFKTRIIVEGYTSVSILIISHYLSAPFVLPSLHFYKTKTAQTGKRQWFSGKIQRCHRWAPSSILGWRIRYDVGGYHSRLSRGIPGFESQYRNSFCIVVHGFSGTIPFAWQTLWFSLLHALCSWRREFYWAHERPWQHLTTSLFCKLGIVTQTN